MGKRITGKIVALVLAILVLLATALPAFAGGKSASSCYTVKDKATGLTTIVCPDGSWD